MAPKAQQQSVRHTLGILLMMKTCGQPPWKGLGPHHVNTSSLLWIWLIELKKIEKDELSPL